MIPQSPQFHKSAFSFTWWYSGCIFHFTNN